MERFSHVNPSPQREKVPLKTSVHFPKAITICKQLSKFVTCNPSPGHYGGVSQPQRHSYYVFRLCWTKWISRNFDSLTLGKNERGRGPRCFPIFWSLKRALELLISVQISPLATFLDHLVDTISPGEKTIKKQTNKQINTHPWSVLWQKILHGCKNCLMLDTEYFEFHISRLVFKYIQNKMKNISFI